MILKKAAILAAFLLFAPALIRAAELGVGLVSVEFDDKTVVEFYESPRARTPVRFVRFFNDPAINSWNIISLESVRTWLAPESLWLDYHSFILRCRSRRSGWLQVIVNNQTGKSYWVRKDAKFQFKTWERYLKEMFAVTRSNRFPQKLYSRPTPKGGEIKLPGRDCFNVLQMRGDWIQVRNAGHCEGSREGRRTGWLRWRRGEDLLIEYFQTS